MLKEFKEFAMRGNVVDMAVGCHYWWSIRNGCQVFGGRCVNAAYWLLLGGVDFSNLFVTLKDGAAPALSCVG